MKIVSEELLKSGDIRELGQFGKQFMRCDWQVPNPNAAGIVDCVGDGRASSGDADLADAAGSHGRVRVRYVCPHHVYLRHVHVHGYVVLCEARIHDATVAFIVVGLLH